MNDPNFDPLVLLDEFKQWGNDRNKLRKYEEPEGEWAWGDEPSKVEQLIISWLRSKYIEPEPDWFNNDDSEFFTNFKKFMQDKRNETFALKDFAHELMQLWNWHFEIEE